MRIVYIAGALLLIAAPAQAGLALSSPQYYPYNPKELRRHPPASLPHARYRVTIRSGTELEDTERALLRGIQENCILQSYEHTDNPAELVGKRRAYAFTTRVNYTSYCMRQMLKKAQKDNRLTNVQIVTEVTR